MSHFVKPCKLQPGDVFDAAPHVEFEIQRAVDCGDVPYDGWEESFRHQAENEYFEVEEIEHSEEDGLVLVYTCQANLFIPDEEDVEVVD